ncbi:hypothetical protein [Rufibacter roseus]
MQILFLRWTAGVKGDQLRRGYLEALDFAKELNSSFWMFDLRGRGGASAEDEQWILEDFFPKADLELGGQNSFAYLLSPSHYLYIKDTVGEDRLDIFSGPSKIKIFMAEAEAVKWLLEQKELILLPKK